MEKQEAKTLNIISRLFSDTAGDYVPRQTILTKISPKTFYNYSPMLQSSGFVVAVTGDKADTRKITGFRLTRKGKDALAHGRDTEPTPPTSTKPATATVLTPQELQTYVDAYNRHNPAWPFELVPKGFRKEVQQTK